MEMLTGAPIKVLFLKRLCTVSEIILLEFHENIKTFLKIVKSENLNVCTDATTLKLMVLLSG